MDAYFTVGLMHLQALHDPAAAIPWFAKIKPPSGADEKGVVSDEKYDEAHALYLSAQMQLAKSEAMVGQVAEAKERHEQLMRRYPQYTYHIRSAGKAQLFHAQAHRARPATGKRGSIQPDRLVTRALTERTPLDALLGTDTPSTKTGPPPSPATKAAQPVAAPARPELPEPARADAAPVEEPRDAARRRTFRTLAIASGLFAVICLCSLLLLHWPRSGKETRP